MWADVVAYSAHVPSFADTWGWVMVRKSKNLHYVSLYIYIYDD